MHPESTHSRSAFSQFLYDRPWIWIVLFYLSFMALTISFVVIAVKNTQRTVPIEIHGR